jgi:hypothetical protein
VLYWGVDHGNVIVHPESACPTSRLRSDGTQFIERRHQLTDGTLEAGRQRCWRSASHARRAG